MLFFIRSEVADPLLYRHLNTSHVILYLNLIDGTSQEWLDLNTSHVILYRIRCGFVKWQCNHI